MTRPHSGHANQHSLFDFPARSRADGPNIAFGESARSIGARSSGSACALLKRGSAWPENDCLIHLDGIDYPCLIMRRRRGLSLRLDGARIVLAASAHESFASLQDFVASSRPWLTRQISSSADFHPPRDSSGRALLLIEGKLLPVFLRPHPVTVAADRVSSANVSCERFGVILSGTETSQAARALNQWMLDQTRQAVNRILPAYASIVGAHYERVRVAHFKGQWGSCRRTADSAHRLSFNARLSMMPEWVRNYVVLHELCHCRVFDHSTRFWRMLDRYCKRLLHCSCQDARAWHERYDALLRIDLDYFIRRFACAEYPTTNPAIESSI